MSCVMFPEVVLCCFNIFSQMTSSTKEPKLFVVAGCLRGITALMVNFTKTMEEGECLCLSVHICDHQNISSIFFFIFVSDLQTQQH